MERKPEQHNGSTLGRELFIPQKKESAVDVVINNIKRLLLTKTLSPGDRLPNETELSQGLGVSRGSVREAMKILSAFGIVEVRQGDGTYICKSPNRVLFDPLLFSLIMEQSDVKELTELRELMEAEVIKLIVHNAAQEDLEKLKHIYEDMESKVRNGVAEPAVLAQCDLNFHYALGNATKNKLVEKIYIFVMEFFAPSIEKTHENQESGAFALQTHKKILDSLLERDPEKAVHAVEESVVVWKRLVTEKMKQET